MTEITSVDPPESVLPSVSPIPRLRHRPLIRPAASRARAARRLEASSTPRGRHAHDHDRTADPPHRHPRGMARRPGRPTKGREGADPPGRRGDPPPPGAAVGPARQALQVRDRRGHRHAGRPLPRPLAAPGLPLHVRPRLYRGVRRLLGDRRRVRPLVGPPGQPRRDVLGHLARAAGQAPGVPAADGLELPLGLLRRQRLQPRLPRRLHRGAAAHGRPRVQLPQGQRNARPRTTSAPTTRSRRAERSSRRCRAWTGRRTPARPPA